MLRVRFDSWLGVDDMVPDQELARHVAEHQFPPGELEMVVAAGLATIVPVEELALDVAQALQPGADDGHLVRMMDAEPLGEVQGHRLVGRVVDRPADRDPVALGLTIR